MPQLSLSLLGSFAATLAERPLTAFETQKTQALLIYLVCQPELAHPREALMTLLWPDVLLSSAQANMRQTLYRLRKLIPEVQSKHDEVAVPFLLSNRQTIQINPDADYFLDVAAFDTGDPTQAIALYRGDFLADFFLPDSEPFEEWAAGQRAAYRRQILEMMAGETAVYIQKANYDTAVQLAQRQLEIDNLRESSHCQLMEAWARNGRRQEALTHYNYLCHLLQTELAIEPSQETHALIETIRADAFDRPQPVLLDKAPRPQHNLPQRLTSFIGRQQEIADITSLISQNRLVMLTGVGGIGKTNLSLQVGRSLIETFPDGVWLVELAPVTDPRLVPDTTAAALGLRESTDRPILIMRAQPDHRENKTILAQALLLLGEVETWDYPERARDYLRESELLLRDLGDFGRLSWNLGKSGTLAMQEGEYEAAQAMFEEGLLLQEMMDLRESGWTLVYLGRLHTTLENYPLAETYYQRILSNYDHTQYEEVVGSALVELGNLCLRQGKLDQAEQLFIKYH